MGLAKSGVAVAELLLANGDVVVGTDDNEQTRAAVSNAHPDVAVVTPEEAESMLTDVDELVVSPGVPESNALLRAARSGGVPVVGEIEVAYRWAEAPIIAVTGTNGKSTTVGLIAEMLAYDRHVALAGNYGHPFASAVREGSADTYVLELSSFQLDTIIEFRADIAVILNITPDHLDRYDNDFIKYQQSKARIDNGDPANAVLVFNADDPAAVSVAERSRRTLIPFSATKELSLGVFVRDDSFIVKTDEEEAVVGPRTAFAPRGEHNAANACAAIAAAVVAGAPVEFISAGLTSYTALPHRMELVGVSDGVSFINDSKATNVDAAAKALTGVAAPVVLILGGRDKDSDFAQLIPSLGSVSLVLTLGEAADRIERALDGHVQLQRVATLPEAVRAGRDNLQNVGTVLLAPACSSFDMFKNFEDRGDAFREAVSELVEGVDGNA